jgi:hypothetical protein
MPLQPPPQLGRPILVWRDEYTYHEERSQRHPVQDDRQTILPVKLIHFAELEK